MTTMKKVAFAWVTEVIDFDNYEEAIRYVQINLHKGWKFRDYCPKEYIEKPYYPDDQYHVKMEKYLSQFVHHTWEDGTIYAFKDKEVKEFWTVEVQKPYGKYNTGW